jgi:hypothetical protein
MENYLRTCDDVLYYDERKYSHWRDTDDDIIQQEKMRLLDLLLISVNFKLKRAEETAEKKICDLLEPFLWGFNDPDSRHRFCTSYYKFQYVCLFPLSPRSFPL